jgi:hypothetical protein
LKRTLNPHSFNPKGAAPAPATKVYPEERGDLNPCILSTQPPFSLRTSAASVVSSLRGGLRGADGGDCADMGRSPSRLRVNSAAPLRRTSSCRTPRPKVTFWGSGQTVQRPYGGRYYCVGGLALLWLGIPKPSVLVPFFNPPGAASAPIRLRVGVFSNGCVARIGRST